MNGWRNRNTWLVNLWLGDDIQQMQFGSPEELEDWFLDALEGALFTTPLKGMIHDMICCGEIDWQELYETAYEDDDEGQPDWHTEWKDFGEEEGGVEYI